MCTGSTDHSKQNREVCMFTNVQVFLDGRYIQNGQVYIFTFCTSGPDGQTLHVVVKQGE